MKQNNLNVTLLTKDEYDLLNQNNYLVSNPFWIIGDDGLKMIENYRKSLIEEQNRQNTINSKINISCQ